MCIAKFLSSIVQAWRLGRSAAGIPTRRRVRSSHKAGKLSGLKIFFRAGVEWGSKTLYTDLAVILRR